jgi:hypothetical protein
MIKCGQIFPSRINFLTFLRDQGTAHLLTERVSYCLITLLVITVICTEEQSWVINIDKDETSICMQAIPSFSNILFLHSREEIAKINRIPQANYCHSRRQNRNHNHHYDCRRRHDDDDIVLSCYRFTGVSKTSSRRSAI